MKCTHFSFDLRAAKHANIPTSAHTQRSAHICIRRTDPYTTIHRAILTQAFLYRDPYTGILTQESLYRNPYTEIHTQQSVHRVPHRSAHSDAEQQNADRNAKSEPSECF